MLSSVFKEIPDNSIEGTKIKDGTYVSYFGSVVLGEMILKESGTGTTYAQVYKYSNHGGFLLSNASTGTRVNLSANSSSPNSYIRDWIVIGSNSLIDTTSYIFQVAGSMSCSTNVKASNFQAYNSSNLKASFISATTGGTMTLYNESGTATVILYGRDGFSNYLVGNTIFTGTGTFASVVTTSLTVDGNTLSSAQWSNLTTINQDINTSNNVSFNDVTVLTGSVVGHVNNADVHGVSTTTITNGDTIANYTNIYDAAVTHNGKIQVKKFGTSSGSLCIVSFRLTGNSGGFLEESTIKIDLDSILGVTGVKAHANVFLGHTAPFDAEWVSGDTPNVTDGKIWVVKSINTFDPYIIEFTSTFLLP